MRGGNAVTPPLVFSDWGFHISITSFGVVVIVGKCQGFMQRWFGKTTWGETLLMCGISTKVHDVFQILDYLNHESSMSLRNWSGKPVAVEASHGQGVAGFADQDR